MESSSWVLAVCIAALVIGFGWLIYRLCRAGAMYDEMMGWEE